MIELSTETKIRIEAAFSLSERTAVENLLITECGDTLPLVEKNYIELAERIRFAVLKLSGGSYQSLTTWVALSKIDWRDTLVAAGFGSSIKGHLDWHPNKG